ncbi:MAG: hypothetical protein COB53_03915 [Elusimicrobia bacterium]|nr:MAG: hypothetical protein COB53_03915 [Elusimicrobiota bacterium]
MAARASLYLLFCFVLIEGIAQPLHAGVFYRPTLGREPLPAEDSDDRTQAGRVEIGRFIPSGVGAAAARPDASGTGAALYRLSMLDAFNGNKMGMLADLVAVTDRDRPRSLYPAQLSYLLGFGRRNGPWRIQFNREEHLPLDRSGGSARYWDVRVGATFEAQLTGLQPFGKRQYKRSYNRVTQSKGATLRGEFGVGYFLHNKSFHARSNQTGLAFLRYEARMLVSAPSGGLRFKLDADFLTDRNRSRYAIANMDLTAGIGIATKTSEIWIERIQTTIIDGPGYEHYFLLKFVVPYKGKK